MNGARLMLSPRVHPRVTKNAGKKTGGSAVLVHTHVHTHGTMTHSHPHPHTENHLDNHNHS